MNSFIGSKKRPFKIFYLLIICYLFISCNTNNINNNYSQSSSNIHLDTNQYNSLSFLTMLQVEGPDIHLYVDSFYMFIVEDNYDVPFSTKNNAYSLSMYKNDNGYFKPTPDSVMQFDKEKYNSFISFFRRNQKIGFSICDTCSQSLDADSINLLDTLENQIMSIVAIDTAEYIFSYINKNGDAVISEFVQTQNGFIENILINYGQEHSYIWFDLYLINMVYSGIENLVIVKTLPMRNTVFDLDFYKLN